MVERPPESSMTIKASSTGWVNFFSFGKLTVKGNGPCVIVNNSSVKSIESNDSVKNTRSVALPIQITTNKDKMDKLLLPLQLITLLLPPVDPRPHHILDKGQWGYPQVLQQVQCRS